MIITMSSSSVGLSTISIACSMHIIVISSPLYGPNRAPQVRCRIGLRGDLSSSSKKSLTLTRTRRDLGLHRPHLHMETTHCCMMMRITMLETRWSSERGPSRRSSRAKSRLTTAKPRIPCNLCGSDAKRTWHCNILHRRKKQCVTRNPEVARTASASNTLTSMVDLFS